MLLVQQPSGRKQNCPDINGDEFRRVEGKGCLVSVTFLKTKSLGRLTPQLQNTHYIKASSHTALSYTDLAGALFVIRAKKVLDKYT